MIRHIKQFKAIGHSAAANICIGFKPTFVIGYNETTLTEAAILMWALTDDDGDGMTGFNHADTQFAVVAANGISQYAGGDEPDGTDAYQDGKGTALTTYATSQQLTEEGFVISTAMTADGDVIHGIAIATD